MAKIRLTSPTFDASLKTVTHASFSDVTLAGIQLIVNVTDQIIIYNFADTTKGGTLAGDVLTLEFDTTTMSDTDELMVLVEDGVAYQIPTGAATAANQASILAAVDGIEALLGTIDADTGAILAAVDTLETLVASTNTKLDTLITQTDGVEATLTAIEGDTSAIQTAVDGIETLIGTTNTTLTTIDGRVDGLETSNSAIQTAVELIDDTVATLGTTTYTEAVNKGLVVGAVRRDANTTLVGTTNEVAPLQVNATGELKVAQIAALPAGTNNIGDVDVLSLIPGTAATNLGKARDSAIGATDTGIAMLGVRRDTPTAETPVAGDYVVPQVSANGEQWVRLAGELADDTAFIVGTTRVVPAGLLADETATDSVDEGDIGIARMTLDRKTVVTPYVHAAAGGWTPYKNLDVDETEDEIKGTAGKLGFIHVINLAATVRYLKIYNATAASVTVGTTTPVLTFPIPTFATTNGAGFTINFGDAGLQFSTAITIAATTGFADNDTGAPGANEVIFNASYL